MITVVNLVCPCGHTSGHHCHADWSESKYLAPSAPGRHTADSITDPALHRLYDERDMYARDWNAAVARAEQAEAERDAAEQRATDATQKWGYAFGLLTQAADFVPEGALRDRILAALDPQEPSP
ncbi:hypothetical protein [Streptomyces sp. NPDC090022]|uniref:hypothetical protein n=1 Tax=Streptomyces sp. NPDC090022 TaxID=3365920 RepID=UPI00382653A4